LTPPSPVAALDSLAERALAVRMRAHAPYSGYHVGAALLADDGTVYEGVNVENASYGLAICAERTAATGMIVGGGRRILAIAVATLSSPPAAPCGMCRQTLAEFGDDTLPVLLVNPAGERVALTLGDLLPRAFRAAALDG
jgi:cytidine deaminase